MQSIVFLLTRTEPKRNLTSLSEKIVIVIGVAKTNGISRSSSGFFMQKIQFYIIMSNWVGQLQDWLDSFVPVRQFYPVRLHNWRYVVGLKYLQTEAIMPESFAQELTKSNTSSLKTRFKAVFFLTDKNKKTLADSLTFDQVKPLSDQVPNSIIKFQKMEPML